MVALRRGGVSYKRDTPVLGLGSFTRPKRASVSILGQPEGCKARLFLDATLGSSASPRYRTREIPLSRVRRTHPSFVHVPHITRGVQHFASRVGSRGVGGVSIIFFITAPSQKESDHLTNNQPKRFAIGCRRFGCSFTSLVSDPYARDAMPRVAF